MEQTISYIKQFPEPFKEITGQYFTGVNDEERGRVWRLFSDYFIGMEEEYFSRLGGQ